MSAPGFRVVPWVRATSRLTLLSLLLSWACVALGQTSVSASQPVAAATHPDGDAWQLRLRYGVSIRSGTEADLGPGLTYSGFSPNDFSLDGWAWFFKRHFGLLAGIEREGFGLYDGSTRVTQGGLLRAHVGVGGRITFGPVSLDASASYAMHQLPVFGTVTTPTFASVTRHGVLLAARGVVDLGPVTIEGRFEYPIALANIGQSVSSSGLGAGGGVRVRIIQAQDLDFGLMAEAAWNQDSMKGLDPTPELQTSQSVVRAGLAVDVRYREPAAPVKRYGTLVVRTMVDGVLAPQAVTVELANGPQQLTTAASGEGRLEGLDGQNVTLRAERAGYVAAEAKGEVLVGEVLALELALVKEPPKVGSLRVSVVSKEGGVPLPAAQVTVAERGAETPKTGVVEFADLPIGPIGVKVTLPDFTPADEAVSILAGRQSDLTVTLVPVKKRLPATVSGQVRNARGGAPVTARLEIRELKKSIEADVRGAFSVEIPGGKYTVKISADGYLPQTKTVTVRDGDQAIFNVDLFPK